MNKKRFYTIVSLAAATTIYAADSYKLDMISVTDKAPTDTFIVEKDILSPSNEQSYSKKSIEAFGKQGNMNVFRVAEMSPSVNYSSVDILGTNESGFHDSIRIRGKKQTGPGGVKSYDGIPISGNPGGGKTIFDMENIESVDVYKGYIPVDKGLAFSNLVGKIDLNIARPSNQFGAELSQSLGSDNLSRSFVRIDTGKIGNVAAFGSFSYTTADKNKGEGEIKRANGSIGVVYKPTDALKTEIFVSQNNDDHHNYYNLSYAETTDLGKYSGKDFNNNRGSINYYDYNKQSFEDTAVVANIEYKPTLDSKISFKPYYLGDRGEYMYAQSATNNVIKWNMDHEVFGAVLKYEKSFSSELNTKFGYWVHRQLPPGPPAAQKKYTAGANGLTFAGWNVLAKNDYHDFHSPFAEVSGKYGNFIYSAGIRYLNFRLGELRSYTNGTNGSTSQNYDTAISNGTLDKWASVKAKYFREWLPSLYLGYNANKDTTVYFDYSRTYGLDVNLFPTYIQQRGTFVGKGVTLQSLWDKLKLETADNFDVGVKYKVGDIYLNPNLYASFVKNKQARIYDSGYNVTYPYNAADAMAYGAELSANGAISKELDFLVGVSYNKYYFTDNLKTASNVSTLSKDKQVPDAPEYLAKAALTYKIGGFGLTPSVKYTSQRYGDVLNREKIDAATIFDFDVTYEKKNILGAKSAEFRLSATNLLNHKYISAINTADDALAATNTAATYQTGAPFGVYANVNFKF